MANIEEKVEKLVKEPIEKIGYKLYDVEYSKEGNIRWSKLYKRTILFRSIFSRN